MSTSTRSTSATRASTSTSPSAEATGEKASGGWYGRVVRSGVIRAAITAAVLIATLLVGATPAAAACVSSIGPGIAPPASVPSGQSGFHAAWYGQSGYMSLCQGDSALATVAYYNSGSRGWVSGRLG